MSDERFGSGGNDFGDFGDLEERLRIALAQEARDIEPGDRLDDIRAEVDAAARGGRPAWLYPVAAAAAVAAIAVAAWIGLRPPAPSVPAGTTTSSVAVSRAPSSPSSSASTAPSSSAAPSTTEVPPSGTAQAVPAYFVAPYGEGKWGLVREFLSAALPAGATPEARATAALGLSLDARPYAGTDGYLQPWPAGTTVSSVVTRAGEIQVVLRGPGSTGLTAEQQRVSVQQVVWTVTAAMQQNLPVRVSVRGDGPIFETMPAGVYKRPPADTAYTDLAPVWVDSPSRGQVLPAAKPVLVQGQACVFEATVSWELTQGATVVRKGFTTASSGCPLQGSWAVALGRLAPGDYQFRAFERSAKDGSVAAQKRVSFTVR